MKAVFLAMLTSAALLFPLRCDVASAKGVLKVVFLGVGEGASTYVEAPIGNQMLIDGGPNSGILDPLSEVVPFGDRSINVLVLTSPEAGDVAGLTSVIKQYSVGAVVEPSAPSDVSAHAAFETASFGMHIPRLAARKGMRIVLDKEDGVEFDVLAADTGIAGQLVYGQTRILFAGGMGKKDEKAFLARYPAYALSSQILEVSKGAAALSLGDALVSAAAPQFVVISAGTQDQYTVAQQQTLDTLEHPGIPTFRTDAGNIIFISDGSTLSRSK